MSNYIVHLSDMELQLTIDRHDELVETERAKRDCVQPVTFKQIREKRKYWERRQKEVLGADHKFGQWLHHL